MQNLTVIQLKGQRVLTTRQLATAYETDVKVIQNNFSRNKERYVARKHYIYMDRDELREVKTTYPQFEGELKRTSRTHFWTEKGALLHAKSLNTDKAWEVYDYLVDFYFRAKEVIPVQEQPKPEPVKESSGKLFVDVPENPEIQKRMSVTRDYLTALDVALREYDMYHEEDRYKNYRVMVDNLSITLLSKVHDLLEIKPNFVRKHY